MDFIYTYRNGLLDLSWWAYIAITVVWLHITLVGITLWFHRDQAHRSIDLHPVLRHFFRFWLWLNTGAPTKEWVAVHRKHHAHCEREGDPHSPRIFGLKKVVLEGAELYRAESTRADTLDKYGKGTPDDWLERNVYGRFTYTGIGIMFGLDLVLFGAPGIVMAALQLGCMPFLAAGIINGVCHAKGYRNFETNDASTNVWRWGLLIAGEELHNNHHAFPTSAKFSMRPGEFDFGWLYLKVFSRLGLVKIRRVAVTPALADETQPADIDTLRAIMINRMHVMRHFMHNVTLPALKRETEQLGQNANAMLARARELLSWNPDMLDEESRARLADLVEKHPSIKTVLEYRNELKALWEGAHRSNDRLLADFKAWCARAEVSGIAGMRSFVSYLQSYRSMPEPAATT